EAAMIMGRAMCAPAALAILVAGCAAPDAGAQGIADACGAASAQDAVGMTVDEAEPRLRRTSGLSGGILRIVRHGQMVTMEFNERRLTANVGPDGRIARVYCG